MKCPVFDFSRYLITICLILAGQQVSLAQPIDPTGLDLIPQINSELPAQLFPQGPHELPPTPYQWYVPDEEVVTGAGVLPKDDCVYCNPGTVIVRPRPLPNWPAPAPPPLPGNQLCVGPSGELMCPATEMNLHIPGIHNLVGGAPQGTSTLQFQYLIKAMKEGTADELCLAIARMVLRPKEPADCVEGRSNNGEDLRVQVSDNYDTDVDFVIKIAGRGSLLANFGAYESHAVDVIYALQLDGRPQWLLYDRLPLYTRWNEMGRILKEDTADVKYIPFSEDDTIKSLMRRIGSCIEIMLNDKATYIYHREN